MLWIPPGNPNIWESTNGFSYKDITDFKEQIFEIFVNKVVLNDDILLRTETVEFDRLLYKASKNNKNKIPIVVRKLSDDHYGLVLGFRSYCVARLLEDEKVKACVTDLNRR